MSIDKGNIAAMIGTALAILGGGGVVWSVAQEAQEEAAATSKRLEKHISAKQMQDLRMDEHLYETATEAKYQSCVVSGEDRDVCAEQKAVRDSVHAVEREEIIKQMVAENAEDG